MVCPAMIRIYLDQNKIVELARVALGKTSDRAIQSLHETLLAGVRAGSIACPLTNAHIVETARIGNRSKRANFARFLGDLSDGWFLAGHSTRLQTEFDRAVARLFSLDVQSLPPTWPLVRGVIPSFGDLDFLASKTGLPAWRMARFAALVEPREQIRLFLEFDDERERRTAIEMFSQRASEHVAQLERRRSQLALESIDLQLRAYAMLLFMEHQDYLGYALAKCNKTFDDLRALPANAVAGIIDAVPCLNVERLLAVQLDRQRQRSLTENDGNDLWALCAAIPYCQFVVSERLWADLVRQTRLAPLYGTTVFSRLSDLAQSLQGAW